MPSREGEAQFPASYVVPLTRWFRGILASGPSLLRDFCLGQNGELVYY